MASQKHRRHMIDDVSGSHNYIMGQKQHRCTLIQHHTAAAKSADLPIIMHNVPEEHKIFSQRQSVVVAKDYRHDIVKVIKAVTGNPCKRGSKDNGIRLREDDMYSGEDGLINSLTVNWSKGHWVYLMPFWQTMKMRHTSHDGSSRGCC